MGRANGSGFDFFLFGLALLPIYLGISSYYYFSQDLPSVNALKREYLPPTVSYMYADDGTIIGEFYKEHRLVVSLDDMPIYLIQAFVAAEDRNFFNHPGVDISGVIRAFIRNREAGKIIQGGSTITQQVTRSFLLSGEKTYERKIKEAILAYRIEQNLTKEDILFLYLNQIYLGEGAYGVESAAKIYFGKRSLDLTLAEASMIAGLAQAPSRSSPKTNYDRARKRQLYVIRQLWEAGFVGEEDAKRAAEEELLFYHPPDVNRVAPQYAELVRRMVETELGSDALYNQGLKIFTAINLKAQKKAIRAVREGLRELDRRHGFFEIVRHLEEMEIEPFRTRLSETRTGDNPVPGESYKCVVTGLDLKKGLVEIATEFGDGFIGRSGWSRAAGHKNIGGLLSRGDVVMAVYKGRDSENNRNSFILEPNSDIQAALICMEGGTGHVKAMVGGRDYEESQFNRAVQAKRQPGSAFKPLVYAAAMDNGYTPADILWDEPVEYGYGDETWSPQNYDRSYSGPITLYEALAKSRNVVAVQLLERVGIPLVVNYAKRMGIGSKLAPFLSLALGASEVTLLELTEAYSTFSNQGFRFPPVFITRIVDRRDNVIYEDKGKPIKSLDTGTAYILVDMLKGVVERGTGGRVAALGRPVAGKTGTSSDLADAWFIGFTPEYTTGVWVGRDRREKLAGGETGGKAAAPIFLNFMKDILEGAPIRDFDIPPSVSLAEIDLDNGWFKHEYSLRTVEMAFHSNQVGPGDLTEGIPDLQNETDIGDMDTELLPKRVMKPPEKQYHVKIFMRDGKIYYVKEPYDPVVAAPDNLGENERMPADLIPGPREPAAYPNPDDEPYSGMDIEEYQH